MISRVVEDREDSLGNLMASPPSYGVFALITAPKRNVILIRSWALRNRAHDLIIRRIGFRAKISGKNTCRWWRDPTHRIEDLYSPGTTWPRLLHRRVLCRPHSVDDIASWIPFQSPKKMKRGLVAVAPCRIIPEEELFPDSFTWLREGLHVDAVMTFTFKKRFASIALVHL